MPARVVVWSENAFTNEFNELPRFKQQCYALGFELSTSSVDYPHSRVACVFFMENSSIASFVSNARSTIFTIPAAPPDLNLRYSRNHKQPFPTIRVC
jgi:hypothetical protein